VQRENYSAADDRGPLRALLADLADLFEKEFRLAKAEFSRAAKSGVEAGIWMGAAGLLGFVAGLLLIESIVFGLASLGLGIGWACLIMALVLGGAAAGAFFYARALVGAASFKSTFRQFNQNVAAVREHLT